MRTSDANKILRQRYVRGEPERVLRIEQEKAELDVAMQLRSIRETAGLTQTELAGMIGTTASVISRLENAEYEGHSLAMLRRIADALGKSVRISFVDSPATAVGVARGAKREPGKIGSARRGVRR
jgi:transcriptional regulator with XRE-family HTH domain